MRKPVFGISNQVRHNRTVWPQKMARGSKYRILEVEGSFYLCSEIKGAGQLCGCRVADLRLCFRICKNRFSHDFARMINHNQRNRDEQYATKWQHSTHNEPRHQKTCVLHILNQRRRSATQ